MTGMTYIFANSLINFLNRKRFFSHPKTVEGMKRSFRAVRFLIVVYSNSIVSNISISMADIVDIAEIQLKIKAVEVALASFTRYRKKEEEERRMAFLDSKLETVQFLDIYFDFPKDKLQVALNKLQEKKNLLLAQQQGRIFLVSV